MTLYKRPVSVLVVIHTPSLNILLLERAAHAGYWQSVTGSQEEGESLIETAAREVEEETGIIAPLNAFKDWQISHMFEIFAEWRYRYAPGIRLNTEHVFSLEVAEEQPIRVSPEEHLGFIWLPWRKAAAKCFSWTNRDVILMLPAKTTR